MIAAQAARSVHAEPAVTKQDSPSVADADRWFQEGRALAKQGRFAEACALFTQSDAIKRTFGTAVNLGDCANRDGHARLAWQLYSEATRLADRDGAVDLARFSRQRASSVASALCTIVVTLEDSAVTGLTVRIGGRDVPPATEIRELVEPGEVDVVIATPSAQVVRKARCSTAGELATVAVSVDRLRAAALSPPAGPATPPHGLRAEASVGAAAGHVVDRAGWLPYAAFDVTVSDRASSWLAIGGRVTGLIAVSSARVMVAPGTFRIGGPVVGGFLGPAIQVAPAAHLSLSAGAGLGAVLASPTHRTYAAALQLGAGYSPSAVWHASLEGLGMKQPGHPLGVAIVALIGAWLR